MDKMMFERITPEEAGISSDRIAEYIARLERRGVRRLQKLHDAQGNDRLARDGLSEMP